MMIQDMKELELNEQEMNSVTGGYIRIPKELLDSIDHEKIKEQDEAFYEAVGTAWEVVKYAFELCG